MNPFAPIEESVGAFTDRFVKRAGDGVESVVFSPFPFTGGQLLIVCKGRIPFLREVMVAAQLSDPPAITTYWLRSSEFRNLSLPSYLSRYQGRSYWLRYKGKVLWGRDIRSGIPLPESPRRLLEVALSSCLTWDRNHLFLECLAKEKHAELIKALATLARGLMATALLLCGEWEVDEETVFDRFAFSFGADGAKELCSQLSAVLDGMPGTKSGPIDPAELKRRAREGVWLIERLVRMLRRHVE